MIQEKLNCIVVRSKICTKYHIDINNKKEVKGVW